MARFYSSIKIPLKKLIKPLESVLKSIKVISNMIETSIESGSKIRLRRRLRITPQVMELISLDLNGEILYHNLTVSLLRM